MSLSEIQEAGRRPGETPVELAPTGDELKQAVKIKTARAKAALETRTHRYAEVARDRAELARRRASVAVQERPLASVSASLGIGLLAGLALGVCAGQALERRLSARAYVSNARHRGPTV